MHPESARQLKQVIAAVLARAGGACEACGAQAPLVFSSAIDGLPSSSQALALCERCRPTIESELGQIANIGALEARIAEIRKR
jgi:hypothetical protein